MPSYEVYLGILKFTIVGAKVAKQTKIIKVDKEVYDKLLGRKKHPRQPFSEVIDSLIGKKKMRKNKRIPGL